MKKTLTGLLMMILAGLSSPIVQAQDITVDYSGPYEGMPGDTIWFEVSVSDVTGLDIGNYNYTILFDENLFEEIEIADIYDGPVVPTTTTKGVRFNYEARLAWANVSNFLQGEGVLLSIRAVLSETGYNESGITIIRYVFGTDQQDYAIEPPFPYAIPVNVYDSEPAEIDVDATLLDFGEVILGETGERELTISNSGVSDLIVSNIVSDTSAFHTDFLDSVVVAPSESINVAVTFQPENIGFYEGTLTIEHDILGVDPVEITLSGLGVTAEPELTVLPSSIEFGETGIGYSSVMEIELSNTGNMNLEISSVESDTSVFIVDFDTALLLEPGESANVAITFIPVQEDAYAGTITIVSNDANSPAELAVTGTGIITEPELTVLPSSIEFGETGIGFSSVMEIELSNTGDANLEIAAVESDTSVFVVDFDTALLLEPGGSVHVAITFIPEEEDAYAGTITIVSNDANSPAELAVTGTGIILYPGLVLSETALNFGEIDLGESEVLYFEVENSGEVTLHVSDITSGNAVFVVISDTDFQLEQGETQQVSVQFTPEEDIEYDTNLTIESNDPVNSPATVTLTGSGHRIPTAVSADVPLEFSLEQNYPNPFNPVTVIRYSVPKTSHVNITVYSVNGQHVSTLVDETRSPGQYLVSFRADTMPSGVYLYRMRTEAFDITRTMMFLK